MAIQNRLVVNNNQPSPTAQDYVQTIPFLNGSGDAVPAYAAMAIIDRDVNGLFVTGYPAYDRQNSLLINSGTAVNKGSYGVAVIEATMPITYNISAGLGPLPGEEW